MLLKLLDFNQIWHNDTDHQVVIVGQWVARTGAQQIQDDGR